VFLYPDYVDGFYAVYFIDSLGIAENKWRLAINKYRLMPDWVGFSFDP